MLILLTAAALAAPCPELLTGLDAAWVAFNDAELDRTDDALRGATESLWCQPTATRKPELLELYWLRALTALAKGDRAAANVAVVRAVTVDPKARPPASYGPDLATLVQTWCWRLGGDSVFVAVDASDAWVDGEPIGRSRKVAILPGEHLLQWRDVDGFHSEIREITKDLDIATPRLAAAPPVASAPPPVRSPVRPSLLAPGILSTFTGVTLATVGYAQKHAIEKSGYTDDAYGLCDWFDDCYDDARQQKMQSDATRIHALYASGAAFFGVGVALVGVGLVVHPAESDAGTALVLTGTW